MNDSPGWASPRSSRSEEQGPGGGNEDSARDGAPPTWSKQQPPAGEWSAPGAGGFEFGGGTPPSPPAWQQPRSGGPGWGAPSGWQQPAWGKPTSPKPGVIPLRPLGVGEILDGAVSTMRAHWRTVLGVSFVVALISQTAIAVLEGLGVYGDTSVNTVSPDPTATADEFLDAFSGLLAARSVALVITMVGVVMATAVLTMVTSRAVLGHPVTTREAWADARPQLLRLFGLTGLMLLIGVSLLAVCVAPGVVLAVNGARAPGAALVLVGLLAGVVVLASVLIRLCLASPALMLERQGIIKAMKRSVKLVRGSWWRVFGIQLLSMLLVYIVTSIIQIPFVVIGAVASPEGLTSLTGDTTVSFLIILGVGAVIGSTITFPISAGVTALLYMDQRIRREALDLELARAAGVPGFGTTPAPTAPAPTARAGRTTDGAGASSGDMAASGDAQASGAPGGTDDTATEG
jgi:hypothetical protein